MLMRWPEDPAVWPANLSPPHLARGTTLDGLVELRDVGPTLLHAAGAMPGGASASMDGVSLLCLMMMKVQGYGSSAGSSACASVWRTTLSLEHNICYNASNHWSAITDGNLKYIFEAQNGHVQLFDLSKDPQETRNVANDPAYVGRQEALRAALVKQYEAEGRGPMWVRHGQLVARPNGQGYGPNYPGQPPADIEADAL